MGEIKLISEHLPTLLSILGLVAWLIRLEAKVLYSEKDIVKIQASHEKNIASLWEKLESIQTTLNQLLVSVGELKGRLEKEK